MSGNIHLLEKPTPQCMVRRQNVLALEPGYKSFQHLFHSTVELSLPLGFGDKSYCGVLFFKEIKSYIFLIKKTHPPYDLSPNPRGSDNSTVRWKMCLNDLYPGSSPTTIFVVQCIAVLVFPPNKCYPTRGVNKYVFP